MIKINKAIAIPIQNGLNTQNQDQLMTLQSLRMINVKPRRAGNPIPLEVDFESNIFDIVYIIG